VKPVKASQLRGKTCFHNNMKFIDNDERKFIVKRIKSFRAMLDDNVNGEPHISKEKSKYRVYQIFAKIRPYLPEP